MADQQLTDIDGDQIESNYDEVVDSFDDMDLNAELLRGKLLAL
jgi:translation initiation factor 4A